MEPKELIDVLKKQHQLLILDLVNIQKDGANSSKSSGRTIIHQLSMFRKHLEEHMKLETESLYANYQAREKEKGNDVSMIPTFISQMDDLGKSISNFLDKYSSADAIEANSAVFAKQLNDVRVNLKNRLETEEESVFVTFLQSV